MQIAKVTASVHSVKTALPLIGSSSADGIRVLAEIETDEGLKGFGMTGRFLAHGTAAAIRHNLGPAITGMDPWNVEAIHARMMRIASERGRQSGINLAAVAAVDLACWDLIGKSSGRSVAQLLGGAEPAADVYVTFGFPAYDDDQLVEMAGLLVAQGHKRLKVLVGTSRGVAADIARMHKVREYIGPDILLAMDANEGIGLDKAVAIAKGVADLDVAWFEDPLQNNDARDLRTLRQRTDIPLSAGQMDGHSSRFRDWLEHDALDIFMPNSMYNGGMTETRRVASLAYIYNRALSDAGGGGIFCLHHVAGFAHGTLAEMHLGVEQVEAALFKDPPHQIDGRMAVPDAPGWGVELDRDRLKDTRIDA